MSQVNTHACDVVGCGKQKQATNHWYKVLAGTGWATIVEWDEFEVGPQSDWIPTIRMYNKGTVQVHDACGLPHAQQLVEGALAKAKEGE